MCYTSTKNIQSLLAEFSSLYSKCDAHVDLGYLVCFLNRFWYNGFFQEFFNTFSGRLHVNFFWLVSRCSPKPLYAMIPNVYAKMLQLIRHCCFVILLSGKLCLPSNNMTFSCDTSIQLRWDTIYGLVSFVITSYGMPWHVKLFLCNSCRLDILKKFLL